MVLAASRRRSKACAKGDGEAKRAAHQGQGHRGEEAGQSKEVTCSFGGCGVCYAICTEAYAHEDAASQVARWTIATEVV